MVLHKAVAVVLLADYLLLLRRRRQVQIAVCLVVVVASRKFFTVCLDLFEAMLWCAVFAGAMGDLLGIATAHMCSRAGQFGVK